VFVSRVFLGPVIQDPFLPFLASSLFRSWCGSQVFKLLIFVASTCHRAESLRLQGVDSELENSVEIVYGVIDRVYRASVHGFTNLIKPRPSVADEGLKLNHSEAVCSF
jgi:hypothetical protein